MMGSRGPMPSAQGNSMRHGLGCIPKHAKAPRGFQRALLNLPQRGQRGHVWRRHVATRPLACKLLEHARCCSLPLRGLPSARGFFLFLRELPLRGLSSTRVPDTTHPTSGAACTRPISSRRPRPRQATEHPLRDRDALRDAQIVLGLGALPIYTPYTLYVYM